MAFCGNPLPNKVRNRVTKKCTEQIIPVFTQYAQLGTVKKNTTADFTPSALAVSLGKTKKRTW